MLVLTDVFSKYAVAVATKFQKATTVAKVLLERWFLHFGAPQCLHSEQGQNFELKVISELSKPIKNCIEKNRTTAWNLKGNRQTERFKCTLLELLRPLKVHEKRR